MKLTPTHQALSPHVSFPGCYTAAKELGVHRSHLFRVLTGERRSARLTADWKGWLQRNPGFARLQKP